MLDSRVVLTKLKIQSELQNLRPPVKRVQIKRLVFPLVCVTVYASLGQEVLTQRRAPSLFGTSLGARLEATKGMSLLGHCSSFFKLSTDSPRGCPRF